jgi:hypothetical protein
MQKENQTITHRVITMLNRKEMDFLDKLGKDALFSTGHKLSYNDILEGLVDFAMEAGISGKGVDSFAKLQDKLRQEMPGIVEQLKKAKEENEVK